MIYSLRAVRPDCAQRSAMRPFTSTTGRFRTLRFLLNALAAGMGPTGFAPVKAHCE